jgi:hypothetical protein
VLYPVDVAGESLQNFGDDDSRGGKRPTSAIIRRNSAPARPGEELKKSIQTELSTRIKRGFSARPLSHPSRFRFRSSEE